jgi:mono/diheme cytochrome c family protein
MPTALLLGVALAGVPTKTKNPEERGEDLYRAHCQGCHGVQALGDGPALAVLRSVAPPLAGRVEALPNAPEIGLILDGRGDMPGYASVMGIDGARDVLLWLSRLDPDTGQHPRKKPPKLQSPIERDKPPPEPATAPEAPAPATPEAPAPAEPTPPI